METRLLLIVLEKIASFVKSKLAGNGFTRTNFAWQNLHGFTLIELLVVISILAILSVVGFVSFQNVQKSARDAKIKADLNAIKKAYEVNYDPSANGGQGGYLPLTSSQFANNQIPKKPDNTDYTYAYGPDSVSTGNKTDGYKVTATLSDGTTSTSVISNQGTQSGSQLNSCDPGATLSNGLVGYWKFDEGSGNVVANSSSAGSSKNGTWNGTGSHWTTIQEAKIGNSAGKFSGSGDGGGSGGTGDSVSFVSWPDVTQPALTVGAWIYPTRNINYPLRIIGGQQYFGNSQFMLSYVNANVNFTVDTSDGNGDHASSVTSGGVSLSSWHYVAGTFDGTAAKIYVDSTPVVTGNSIFSGSLFNNNPTEPFVMGRNDCSVGCYFYGGRLDDVRIYNRVLTDSEIGLLASGCSP